MRHPITVAFLTVFCLNFLLINQAEATDHFGENARTTDSVERLGKAAWAIPGQSQALDGRGQNVESWLTRGLELERAHRWLEAIDQYKQALEVIPEQTILEGRLELCRMHERLGRRYADPSFRDRLLALPTERALQIYVEVLTKIDQQYVDPISHRTLVRQGLDNLEVALRDPVFLDPHLPDCDPEQIRSVRSILSDWRSRLVTKTVSQDLSFLRHVYDLAERRLSLDPTPVILEFCVGACDALDDHTIYLTPNRLEDLYAVIEGSFIGIGVELQAHEDQGLEIVHVLPGGPAAQGGMQDGDVIVEIDGRSLVKVDLETAAGYLQGPKGSRVELGVRRQGRSVPPMKLVREPVEVQSVTQVNLLDREAGIGYLQMTGFQKSTTSELEIALESLQRQGMQSLILDLRDNPGGLLTVAVDIADLFLDRGVIVSTRGRALGQSFVYQCQMPARYTLPMAVLINQQSASASEILAGALKDHRRARVIGQTSYGKGSVQSIFSLQTIDAGIKLTTARFFSPRNQPYTGRGVEPDDPIIVVAKPPLTTADQSGEPAIAQATGQLETDLVLRQSLRLFRDQLDSRVN